MATLLARRSESRAERLVQREYDELRAPTLRALRSRLAGQGITFDDADLDAFYNQAWHGLYEQLVRGEEVENRGGFLVVAAHRRAIEELRRLHPDRRADGVDPGETAQELDLTQRLDDRRRLTGVMEGMRERLSERERQAAALCYLHGYSRPEAAAALGLAPKRMEKLMDGVSSKLGTLTTEIDDGDWCESRQSLMKAYAYGVLDPDGERYALARAHLEECPACRKYVRGLRGIAAVVPPVWLPLAGLGILGLGGATAASASSASAAGGGGGAGAGGSGAAAGSGAGGGGLGIAAAAVSVAIVAGGIGTWAVVSSGGDDPAGSGTSTPASAGTRTAAERAAAAKASAKAKAASRRARERRAAARARARKASEAAASQPAATGSPAAAATPVPATPAPAATTPASAPPASAPEPVPEQDPGAGSEPEFGFER